MKWFGDKSQKIENSNGDTSHEYMTVTWKLENSEAEKNAIGSF